jgi:hypothetical protein
MTEFTVDERVELLSEILGTGLNAGAMGTILEIHDEGVLWVKFDGKDNALWVEPFEVKRLDMM